MNRCCPRWDCYQILAVNLVQMDLPVIDYVLTKPMSEFFSDILGLYFKEHCANSWFLMSYFSLSPELFYLPLFKQHFFDCFSRER